MTSRRAEEAILEFAPNVRSLVVRLWGRRLRSDAVEDLVSAGMLGLVKAARTFDFERAEGRYGFWPLYGKRRAVGSAIDAARVATRRSRKRELVGHPAVESAISSEVATEYLVEQARAAISAHLRRKLGERDAKIVSDYHLEGLSMAEIAAREGLSDRRVYMIVSGWLDRLADVAVDSIP